MEMRQPKRRPLGGLNLLVPVRTQENFSDRQPVDFLLQKEPKRRHIGERLRSREL